MLRKIIEAIILEHYVNFNERLFEEKINSRKKISLQRLFER